MSPLALIQLAIGLIKIANWVAKKVDEVQWKSLGYEDRVRDEIAAFKATVGLAEQSALDAAKITPEERRKLLKEET